MLRLFKFSALITLLLVGCNSGSDPDPDLKTGFIPGSKNSSSSSSMLTVGNVAPALKIAKWYQGEAVSAFEPGKVYVIEFWATWCGPCISGMPHLSKLQETYGDRVQIVGVTTEKASIVDQFMRSKATSDEQWKDVIKYAIAIDAKGATNDAYMKAARKDGIPMSFVVGIDGIIDWIGSPSALDQVLKDVTADSWLGQRKINKHARDEDWKATLIAIDQQLETFPDNLYALSSRIDVLRKLDRTDEAIAFRTKMSQVHWDKPEHLKNVALDIIANKDKAHIELAKKATLRAYELTDGNDVFISHALGESYFFAGEIDEAIAQQKKTLELVQSESFRKQYADSQYQSLLLGVKETIRIYESKSDN